MKQIKILRGISGSGKSTYIKNNFPDSIICSADHFFMLDGVYKFDPEKIGQAHQYCFKSFINFVSIECRGICVIDNTNCSAWQIAPYYLAGETFGYNVEIIELNVDEETATHRN